MEVKKRIKKLKISSEPQEDVSILGISSHYSTVWLANCINNYIDADLSFSRSFELYDKNESLEQYSIFTNFTTSTISQNLDFDLFSLYEPVADIKTKYVLIKVKGERLRVFPKLKNIEYLLISDYPFREKSQQISQIQEIAFIFDIDPKLLGNKFKSIRQELQL